MHSQAAGLTIIGANGRRRGKIKAVTTLNDRAWTESGGNTLRMLAVATLMLCSATACAACPAGDVLVERYGISFSGFAKPLPRAAVDPERARRAEGLVRIVLPDKARTVNDGFQHAALIDKAHRQAWILRTGGFAGVYEWYGPLDVAELNLDGCRLEPVAPAREQAHASETQR